MSFFDVSNDVSTGSFLQVARRRLDSLSQKDISILFYLGQWEEIVEKSENGL